MTAQPPAFRPASAWQFDGSRVAPAAVARPQPLGAGLSLVAATLLPLVGGLAVVVTFGEVTFGSIAGAIASYAAPAAAIAVLVGVGLRSLAVTMVATVAAAVLGVMSLVLVLTGDLLGVDAVVAAWLLVGALGGVLGMRALSREADRRPAIAWMLALVGAVGLLATTLVAPLVLSGVHAATLAYVGSAAPPTVLTLAAAVLVSIGGRAARVAGLVALAALALALVVTAALGTLGVLGIVLVALRVACIALGAVLVVRSLAR